LLTTASVLAGDWIYIGVSSNNTSTTDGDNSEVSGVADTRGNPWQKVGEWTNANGSAGAGVTLSVWRTQVSVDIPANDMTITVTYGSARANKAISAYAWRSSTFSGSITLQGPITPDDLDAANGFGSVSQPSAPTVQALYLRFMGKEANTTTALTPTSGWTAIPNTRSSNVAAARTIYGEFIIQDSTGQTSNPTLAVSGDTAGVFVSITEGLDTNGDTRITQQHAIVVHSQENTPIRLTQQQALVVHSQENTPARLTQLSLLVVHSQPFVSTGGRGNGGKGIGGNSPATPGFVNTGSGGGGSRGGVPGAGGRGVVIVRYKVES
jgi:hypothetical protein